MSFGRSVIDLDLPGLGIKGIVICADLGIEFDNTFFEHFVNVIDLHNLNGYHLAVAHAEYLSLRERVVQETSDVYDRVVACDPSVVVIDLRQILDVDRERSDLLVFLKRLHDNDVFHQLHESVVVIDTCQRISDEARFELLVDRQKLIVSSEVLETPHYAVEPETVRLLVASRIRVRQYRISEYRVFEMHGREEECLGLLAVHLKSRDQDLSVEENVVAYSVAVKVLGTARDYVHHLPRKIPVSIGQLVRVKS